jgi:UrcA family protein
MRMRFLWVLAVFAAIIPDAQAQQMQTATVRVSYDDLDLTSRAGRAMLQRRINSAARAMCRRARTYSLGIDFLPDQDCLNEALASAAAGVELALRRAGESRRAQATLPGSR